MPKAPLIKILESIKDGGRRHLVEDIARTMGGATYDPNKVPQQTAAFYLDTALAIEGNIPRFQSDAVESLPDLVKKHGTERTMQILRNAGRIKDSDFPSEHNVALFYLGMEKEVHKHNPAIGQYLQLMGRIKAKYGIT
ncbi:hypothetical protein J4435_00190 [Candidatus Woesearchaeota archaeon]|nr:hypothetical protein [Candidatus Woesearchaeota archaeon]